MMFPDPYKATFPNDQIEKFQQKAIAYIQERQRVQQYQNSNSRSPQNAFHNDYFGYDDDDEEEEGDFFDEDEEKKKIDEFFGDDGEEVPDWVKDKYPEILKK